MIKLIGKENCSRCGMIKNILTNKNKKFEYYLLESLPQLEQDKYIKLAQESNMVNLPLIVVDDKLKTLEEVIA